MKDFYALADRASGRVSKRVLLLLVQMEQWVNASIGEKKRLDAAWSEVHRRMVEGRGHGMSLEEQIKVFSQVTTRTHLYAYCGDQVFGYYDKVGGQGSCPPRKRAGIAASIAQRWRTSVAFRASSDTSTTRSPSGSGVQVTMKPDSVTIEGLKLAVEDSSLAGITGAWEDLMAIIAAIPRSLDEP